jgi:hypothetical protein
MSHPSKKRVHNRRAQPNTTHRSGPSIPRDQRYRKGVELTLDPETITKQNDIIAVTGETRSTLVDRLTQEADVPTPRQWAAVEAEAAAYKER